MFKVTIIPDFYRTWKCYTYLIIWKYLVLGDNIDDQDGDFRWTRNEILDDSHPFFITI
jgi:hypothetical protein